MKRYILISTIIIAFGLTVSVGYRKLRAKKLQGSLEKQFILALDNPDKIDDLLKKAPLQGKTDTEVFRELLQLTDSHGWNILMHFVVRRDIKTVKKLFQLLDSYIKSPDDLYKFLSATDDENRSALFLAVQRKDHPMVEVILENMKDYFEDRPDLFFKIIYTFDRENHWTPLLMAAYNDHYSCVELLVLTAVKVLGENSPEFEKFINATDYFGDNAYNYAKSYGRRLLFQYGANVENVLSQQGY